MILLVCHYIVFVINHALGKVYYVKIVPKLRLEESLFSLFFICNCNLNSLKFTEPLFFLNGV